MAKWSKADEEVVGEATYKNELGQYLVMEQILRTLVEEGKIDSLDIVWAPRSEVATEP